MAQLAFKGIQLVTAEQFKALTPDTSILYFVRTNESKTDGYMQLNGKKYGTGADVIAKYGELDNKTIAKYVQDYVAEQLKAVNSTATELVGKVAKNTAAIEKINGEGDGSITKALADAKAYTDTAKTDIIGSAGDASTVDTIKGAKKGVEEAKTAATNAQTAADNAQKAADAKVKSVEGTDTVVATTTEHAVSVSLKTSDKGNVKFTQDTDGLSANVTIPAATVTGVKADDKFLSLTDKLVGADVSIAYDVADKKIYLYGKDKTKANAVSSIDCKDFIKDGMLSNAELVTNPEGQEAGTYIKLTWNTDGPKEPMYINVTSLIDVYTAGNGLKLTDHEFSVNFDVAATKDSVDKVTGKVATLESRVGSAAAGETGATGLFKGVADNKAAIDAEVARAKGAEQANAAAIKNLKEQVAKDVVTVKNATDDKYVKVTKAEDSNAYTVASQGIDAAIKTVVDTVKVSVKAAEDAYVTGSVDTAGRVVTLSEKIQAVGTSSATAKGLAEASDVKDYVDKKVSDKNVSATGDTFVSASADGNKVTVAATADLKEAVTKAKSAVQSVNGKSGSTVDLSGADIKTNQKVGENATATVNAVLADIYTKLGLAVKADGATIKEGAEHKLSVNLEAKTESTVAAGHVTLEHGTDGALYGVMYYSGDDAE